MQPREKCAPADSTSWREGGARPRPPNKIAPPWDTEVCSKYLVSPMPQVSCWGPSPSSPTNTDQHQLGAFLNIAPSHVFLGVLLFVWTRASCDSVLNSTQKFADTSVANGRKPTRGQEGTLPPLLRTVSAKKTHWGQGPRWSAFELDLRLHGTAQ